MDGVAHLESRLRPVHHGALQKQRWLHLPLDSRLLQPQKQPSVCNQQHVEEVSVNPEAGMTASGYVLIQHVLEYQHYLHTNHSMPDTMTLSQI